MVNSQQPETWFIDLGQKSLCISATFYDGAVCLPIKRFSTMSTHMDYDRQTLELLGWHQTSCISRKNESIKRLAFVVIWDYLDVRRYIYTTSFIGTTPLLVQHESSRWHSGRDTVCCINEDAFNVISCACLCSKVHDCFQDLFLQVMVNNLQPKSNPNTAKVKLQINKQLLASYKERRNKIASQRGFLQLYMQPDSSIVHYHQVQYSCNILKTIACLSLPIMLPPLLRHCSERRKVGLYFRSSVNSHLELISPQ